MHTELVDTWMIHDRVNLYLFDALAPAGLAALPASRGRSVGEQFAHIHNVRLLWFKAAAPERLEGLAKVEKADAGDAALLRSALVASGEGVRTLLERTLAEGGRIRGFKPHAVAFLGYLVSHESHHRGQIVLTMKQAGHPVDRKILYGMWEWGTR